MYRQHPRSKNARKMNPFQARFTLKLVRFLLSKLINIWIETNSYWSCIQSLKIPSKSSSFARKTDLKFLAFFDLGCCLCSERYLTVCRSQQTICLEIRIILIHYIYYSKDIIVGSQWFITDFLKKTREIAVAGQYWSIRSGLLNKQFSR